MAVGARHAALALALAALSAPQAAAFDLAAAVAAAQPGDVLRVPAGVHRGGIVLDKPLSLVGEPGAVLDAGGAGDVLRIEAPDTTVRGLTLQNTGKSLDRENSAIYVLAPRATIEDNVLRDVLFGICLKDAPDTVVRANHIGGKDLEVQRRGDAIRLWQSHRTRIEDNVVERSRDVVIWYSSGVVVRGNRIRDGRYGLHFMYSDGSVVADNEVLHNSVGAFLMYSRDLRLERNLLAYNRGPSGYGLGLKDMGGVSIVGNRVLGNRVGLYLDESPNAVDVHDRHAGNLIAFNDIGVAFQPAVRRNTFVDNTFLENVEQVAVMQGSEVKGNEFSVGGRGNFWSDYAGYDLDGDGVGDLPHRPVSLFESLIDRHPKLRLFLHSPVAQAIELAARTVPAIRPRAKLVDAAPLVRPAVAAPVSAPSGTAAVLMGAVAAGLLAVPLGLIGLGRRRRTPGGAPTGTPVATPRRDGPAPEAVPILRVVGLTKRFGRVAAVEELSFDVGVGEALVLWGRNGAGKTTVIRSVLGLLRSEGRIEVGGLELRRHGKAVRRLVGYVPQELALHDDLTVRETLDFYGRLKRAGGGRAAEVLGEVGLETDAHKRVAELSGGMKQRLALGVALLADPRLLVLDELTSNLDAAARAGFLALLQRLKAQGKTVLFISHRLDEVEALADRVLVLDSGRRRLECGPAELAERLGLRVTLKLHVAARDHERATALLRERGYAVRPNGTGFWIEVRADAKLAPLEALFAHGVQVVDFDLGSEAGA